MRCYYEVLEVSREAESAEIKSSYRKLALRWHPDKNLDNSDEAKEQFQLVQNAYEVLSDPQERAWYDSHREQLLRGAGAEFNDESLNLIPYFMASCYKGFGDDDKGFYAVYREVFNKLAAEEVDYMDDPEDVNEIPVFGKSDTDYEEIKNFYSYWSSFSTSKSYVWLDKYDIREADNRKILKLLEKENNKIRQKARKERNEEIRELVNFVRKRDKRVIAHAKLVEEKAIELKKKNEEVRKEKQRQRQQELEEAKKQHNDIGVYNMNNFDEQLDQIQKHFVEEFGDSDDDNYVTESSEDENNSKENDNGLNNSKSKKEDIPINYDDLQNLYCMACSKFFKNVKSFENHEKSKKHKENVMNLELETDIPISGDECNDEKIEDLENLENSDTEIVSEEQVQSKSKKKKNKKAKSIALNHLSDDEETSFIDLDVQQNSRKSRKAKKLEDFSKSILSENKMNGEISTSGDVSIETQVDKPETENVIEKIETESTDVPTVDHKKTSKSKKKDKKLLHKKSVTAVEIDVSNIDTSHCCAICKNEFTSKNKLFDHLKKTGHQIYLPDSQSNNVNTKSQKKKLKQKT